MKFRSLLVGFVLALVVLFVGSFKPTVQAFGCTTFCANGYNSCMIDCNGDADCQHECYVNYECCRFLCDGSGTCQ